MTTLSNEETSQSLIKSRKQSIDRSVRSLLSGMEQENTIGAETPVTRFQKVLKI